MENVDKPTAAAADDDQQQQQNVECPATTTENSACPCYKFEDGKQEWDDVEKGFFTIHKL